MCADIANFYLNNPMDRYEYMKLPMEIIPEEIIQQYKLRNLEYKGFVYMEIQKGMYGLPQEGKIANGKCKLHLAMFGYEPEHISLMHLRRFIKYLRTGMENYTVD